MATYVPTTSGDATTTSGASSTTVADTNDAVAGSRSASHVGTDVGGSAI